MEGKHSFVHSVPEWGRFLAERFLVLPAAAYLPKSWALRVADGVGFVEARLPIAGTRVARREMRAAGIGDGELNAAVSEHLSWYRRNLVYAVRLWRGREHPRDWQIRETNGEAIHALRDEGRALLLVSGHFVDTAGMVVNTVLFPELAGRAAAQEIPAFSWSPFILRRRLENNATYGLARYLVDPARQRQFPRVGHHGVFAGLVAQLQGPQGCAKILGDAYWEKEGAYQRPFAGMRRRGFALGAARVARAAQCQVATYVAVFEDAETVRIEWNMPHEPPAADDEAGDRVFMDVLIGEMERMVGRHPRQYLHPIGSTRTWDAASQQWS